MVLNKIGYVVGVLVIILSGACASSITNPHPAMTEKNAAALRKMVGDIVELEGRPVGDKARHAILTKYGRIDIAGALPDEVFTVFDQVFGSTRRIVVRGRLIYLEQTVNHWRNSNESEQSDYNEGDIIPAHFELLDVEVVRK